MVRCPLSGCVSWKWMPTMPLTSTGRCTSRAASRPSTFGTWTTALRAWCSSRRVATAPRKSWAVGTPSTSLKSRRNQAAGMHTTS
uniref:Capping protein (Actin filament) muscle Z-line, beta n=1 Tax=Rhipicephalus appendiculatus TaxID=34631 RepID=A0A131YLF6_RHIAP